MSASEGPLKGIHVADFSRVIAGPLASMHLADLGADVVIENFSTGVMTKFPLDYESVNRPDLIYCSTSAYGRTGPFQKRLGYDPVAQAESGFMSLTGHPDQEPVRTAIPMCGTTERMVNPDYAG